MDRLLVVLPMVVVAIGVAFLVQRRRPDPPSQPVEHAAPEQIDRDDFGSPSQPWMVIAFTSATCDTCAAVAAKVAVLASDEVATLEVEYGAQKAVHERYRITAVPTVVIADAHGVVQRSFIGSTSATHLWAAVAELREPGSVPDGGCAGH